MAWQRVKRPRKGSWVGDKALSNLADATQKSRALALVYPVRDRIVTDWDAMERVWRHTISEVLDPEREELYDCCHSLGVLLTEPPLNPKANREKMTQIWFETFNAGSVYVATGAVLSLYGSKSYTASFNTGIALDSGGGITHIAPVYEGHVLPHAVKSLALGGNDLIDCTGGQQILCQDKRHRCVEPLFEPSLLLGPSSVGIHELTYESIMECDVDIRTDLSGNIVLSGGNTMFPGLADRLQKTVQALAPPTMRIKAFAPSKPGNSAWVGGSMLCSSEFDPLIPASARYSMFITHEEYNEHGPCIVHRNCF
eukprot:COSAG02_NODE_56_length_43700_cov_33.650765_3_plen_311_part_00